MAHFYYQSPVDEPKYDRGIITLEDIYHERYSGHFKCVNCAKWWKSVSYFKIALICPNCKTGGNSWVDLRFLSKSDVAYVDGHYRFRDEELNREWTNLMENVSDKQYKEYFGSSPHSSSQKKEEESNSSGGHTFGRLMFAAVLGYFVYSFMEDY